MRPPRGCWHCSLVAPGPCQPCHRRSPAQLPRWWVQPGSVTLGTPSGVPLHPALGHPAGPMEQVPWQTPARTEGRLHPQARQALGFYGDVYYPAL